MKKTLLILITAVSLVAVGLIILLVCTISNGRVTMNDNDLRLTDTKNIKLEGIDMLSIKYYSDNIVFIPSDTEELVIKEYKNYTPKDSQQTKVTTEDNKVTISGTKWPHIFSGFGNWRSRVEVYLPDGYSEELSVSVSSGDISSDMSIRVNRFSASSSSGDIVLKEITAENISLSASSGDINIEKAIGQLNAAATSGDISISGLSGTGSIDTSSGDTSVTLTELTGDLKLVASSGDISLKLPDTISFHFKADASSGEIETFFDDKLSYNERKNHASGDIGASAEFNINVKVSSGDINVDRN